MKVLLIRPPYKRLQGYHPEPYFPLGIGYVGAVMEKDGHDVKIWNVDMMTDITAGVMPDELVMYKERQKRFEIYQNALNTDDHPVWKEVQDVLDSFDPDIVGLSVLTPEVGSAYKLSCLAKQSRKDRIVMWGGHHSTFLAEDVLGYGSVDIVVRGEGENIVPELMPAIAEQKSDSLKDIKGVSYIIDNKIHHNPDQDLPEDLDALPFPAHHLSLFPEAYKRMERIGIMSNRGCPFRCGYCSSPAFTKRSVRFRSYENVLEEVEYVTKYYKKNIVSFLDDNFTINKKRVTDLCEHMMTSNLNISWDTMTRADILTEDVVKLLAKADCCGISIGIESGSERVLKQINKDVKLDKVIDAYEMLYKYNIPSGANFIIGFPEETEEDIYKTFSIMKKIRTVNMNFNVFEPIPGSPLLTECNRLDLVPKDVDWRTYGFWPMHHYVKDVSRERFTEIVFEVARWVLNYKKSFKIRWARIKPYIAQDPLFPFKKICKSLKVRILQRMINREEGL